MNQFYNLKNQLLLIAVLAFNFINYAQEDIPFNCDFNAYLFQYNDVYAIDLASGNSYLVQADVTEVSINAAAYNPADGFIWGSLKGSKEIVRIGKNFTTSTYNIPELPDSNRYVGGISAQGMYYLKGGGTTYYKVDLNPESTNYIEHNATENLSLNINIHDWAFNAVDNQLYTVEKSTNVLYRINPENGVVTSLGEVPILAGNNYTYGAVYFDVDGRFYVSANQTGTIYVIQNVQDVNSPTDMDSNLFAFGPSSASNDGARCPTAPVPQEICDNGIDDDGDGLIDCEDPSCSGFGMCDVIEPPTSGANDGGLESNNRLSEQINKRNFNRVKNGYKFNSLNAPRLAKDFSYAQRNGDNNFTLQEFIPLEIIGETEAIVSTPSDLVNITNASEIYAVDYMNNETSVASILALKTENGVYEHTKYICDRLLGAELISVNTIDINEHAFIKSIIKNIDGTYEFVLSFSAKVINNNENFAVESHWNLDQYEENVTFYNFQIWTNSVDNLYHLGEEVLSLLNIEKPIADYNNSTPPTVFVRKGQYQNGGLELQIINTNVTDSVVLDAGLRATETSDFNNWSTNIGLNGQYITNLTIETGDLFDIGFRIGDGIATPDDLFMSDGPWGIDDSQDGTTVNFFEVTTNENEFSSNDLVVERNIDLRANTNTYVAAYRALTPRYKAVDLTAFNGLEFSAEGTGTMEITLVKESISNWEDQYKTTITLSETEEDFALLLQDFESSSASNGVFNDVVTVVFTMASTDGSTQSKTMKLKDLRFSQDTLSISQNNQEATTLLAYPNPMGSQATITFSLPQNENLQFMVYDQLGKLVYTKKISGTAGNNNVVFNKANLSSGLYFCKLISAQYNSTPLKLIIK
ncbi:T9SS type A sorting domain-containing protein [Ichthyenterobacterium sp. W332]|uniref:T9SS type A sorting domain-containing protein n=1 Tax=Microcosmobacter mediterraneus TaxID=3075607 RepID=A0ABU2YLE6_9FLAO|nr:T9SS type A sorting domain-containing protein [Ichthyenterobacterium sp. W332]MDT0558979.1 T9SS type A sorting domain-containing protein [Ichthyenterobacterium sp. W332]